MANTGYEWGSWVELLSDDPSANPDAYVVLTQGGTTQDRSTPIDLNLKSGCEVAITVVYSDSVQAAGTGLYVYLLRSIDNDLWALSSYENMNDGAQSLLMEFTQDGTRHKTITISPADMGSFKLGFDWTNSTGSSTATVSTKYRTADIPVAS